MSLRVLVSSRVPSLLAIETVDDSGPLDVARLPGAARLSPLAGVRRALELLARSMAAMVDVLQVQQSNGVLLVVGVTAVALLKLSY